MLVAVDGLLWWLWTAVSPGVAVTLGVALVCVTLAWLRSRRDLRLTLLVGYVQALIVVSLVAAWWTTRATAGDVDYGAGAIVFAALAAVSAVAAWYWIGVRSRSRLLRAVVVVTATVLASCGACTYGAWTFTSGFGTS